ncbi:MAG: exonuclease subunit SbcD [Caldilineaceae bacterium]|nr:exonuclease subunit SbcD [Caldilineaceae bacterium]
MRILHTADWHLNHRLGRIDRNEDICRCLRQIAAYLEEYQVDVMLVAGDLFDRKRVEDLREGFATIRTIFLPFLERGGTIVAISGNHDNEIFFETLRDAFDLVMPVKGTGEVQRAGRLYIAPNPRLLRLADREGTVVQFVLMPYPTVRAYLRGEPTQFRSIEEKHRAIQDKFARTVVLMQEPAQGFDVSQQAVLVSHVHVRGVTPHSLYNLSEAEDVVFEPNDIPTHWAYVAYGHIHAPQKAREDAEHVRYAGSIERLNFGEAKDSKSVVLIEIDSGGLRGAPQILPLPATPIYQIELTDPLTQIPRLREQYPDAEQALVNYTLHWQAGVHDRDGLCQQIQEIFPRWYARSFKQLGSIAGADSGLSAQRLDDVAGNVRDYLKRNLGEHTEWDEISALAEELLAAEAVSEELLS